jgi:hypothetical protein
MAIEYPGNAIPAPGFVVGNSTSDLELLYSTAKFTQKGVSLKPGQGIIPLGTVLGQVTATKQWVVYSSGAGDGSQNPVGLLRQTVDTGVAGSTQVFQNNIVISGIVKNSLVSGADANAITKLGAVVKTAIDAFSF